MGLWENGKMGKLENGTIGKMGLEQNIFFFNYNDKQIIYRSIKTIKLGDGELDNREFSKEESSRTSRSLYLL